MSIDAKFEGEGENEELVIRIPVSAIPYCVTVACDEHYGFEQHNIEVENLDEFKEEFLNALLDEEENGDTVLHKAFDKEIINCVENGAFGLTFDE